MRRARITVVLSLVCAFVGSGLVRAVAVGDGAARPHAGVVRVTEIANPIVPVTLGQDSPDPFIQYFRGSYYMTYTASTHVEIRQAPTIDLLATARPVTVWPRPGQRLPANQCCHIWAPEFHLLRGPHGTRWYLYYSAAPQKSPANTGERIYVLEGSAGTPLGPYRQIQQLNLHTQSMTIDPDVVQRPDGSTYVFFAAIPGTTCCTENLYVSKLSNPWTTVGSPTLVSRPTYSWETKGHPINEGPSVITHGGRLTVVYSASQFSVPAAYSLGLLSVPVTANLLDPQTWVHAKRSTPILRSSSSSRVWAPGHCGFFASPDGRQEWIVYHAYSRYAGGSARGNFRTSRVQPIAWNRDGTPKIGAPLPLHARMRAPSGDPSLSVQFEDTGWMRAVRGQVRTIGYDDSLVGGGGLVFHQGRRGSSVSLSLRLPAGGRFRPVLRLMSSPFGGRVAVTSHLPGESRPNWSTWFDAFGPGVSHPRALTLPQLDTRAGSRVFTFTVTGRDKASHGYKFLLDELILMPA